MKLPNTIESCHVLIRELLKQVESLTILVEEQAVIIKKQGAEGTALGYFSAHTYEVKKVIIP